MLRHHRRVTGIHQHEAAGAVSVFGHARLQAGLSKSGGLLIAGNTGNRNAAIEPLFFAFTHHFATGAYARQQLARNVEQGKQLVVPFAGMNVEQQGARSVAGIGDMGVAIRQFPYQPAIDGAKGEFATFGS